MFDLMLLNKSGMCSALAMVNMSGLSIMNEKTEEIKDFDEFVYNLYLRMESKNWEVWSDENRPMHKYSYLVVYTISPGQDTIREHLEKLGFHSLPTAHQSKNSHHAFNNAQLHVAIVDEFMDILKKLGREINEEEEKTKEAGTARKAKPIKLRTGW